MNIKCHACGKFGHMANQCRSKGMVKVSVRQFKRTVLHVMHATKWDILLNFAEERIHRQEVINIMRRESRRLMKLGRSMRRSGL